MTGPAIVPAAEAGTERAAAGDGAPPIVPQRAVLVLSTPEGHDSRSLRIAATLAGRGHEVTILARRGPDSAPSEESPAGYRIVRVGTPPQARASRRPRGQRFPMIPSCLAINTCFR